MLRSAQTSFGAGSGMPSWASGGIARRSKVQEVPTDDAGDTGLDLAAYLIGLRRRRSGRDDGGAALFEGLVQAGLVLAGSAAGRLSRGQPAGNSFLA